MAMPDKATRMGLRAHLVRQGERDWAELRAAIEARRAELLAVLAPLSEAQAAWRPDADAWSIEEIVRHLHASTAGAREIILDLAAGHAVRGGNYDSHGAVVSLDVAPGEAVEFAQLRDDFAAGSDAFARAVEGLPSPVDFEATFPHDWFGGLNCRSWFAFQRLHDGDHLNGIREVLSAPGFPEVSSEKEEVRSA